jgi:hypothetical protein
MEKVYGKPISHAVILHKDQYPYSMCASLHSSTFPPRTSLYQLSKRIILLIHIVRTHRRLQPTIRAIALTALRPEPGIDDYADALQALLDLVPLAACVDALLQSVCGESSDVVIPYSHVLVVCADVPILVFPVRDAGARNVNFGGAGGVDSVDLGDGQGHVDAICW